ncbi:hypothetical protein [Streptomyces sp. NBC_01429]|uniref:hypothetical protein n=1 Tax=Streptomyces sp. NBC_01429 TaxID=2903862 RepID=UPI002E2D9AD3|nr:hypothetical protein [Streptomyces sp. NBC_01429]
MLLVDGPDACVKIDRTMSYARPTAKVEHYDAYRNAPPPGRGYAAHAPARSEPARLGRGARSRLSRSALRLILTEQRIPDPARSVNTYRS